MSVILVINAGSSSLKFALFKASGSRLYKQLWGNFKNIGPLTELVIKGNVDNTMKPADAETHTRALSYLIKWLGVNVQEDIDAFGYRIVHDGGYYTGPVFIDKQLLQNIKRSLAFAPDHLSQSLKAIKWVKSRFANKPQIACFDTSFHTGLPDNAKIIPVPGANKYGIRKYGFHGLSYEYIYGELKRKYKSIRDKKIVIAHLGSGSSMVAIAKGKSIDTTMGLTPAGGLIMGTRTGDIDPGVLLQLMQHNRNDPAKVEDVINHKSGLLAVSGLSGNMQILLKNKHNSNATRSIELFAYSAKKHLGSLIAVMGGIDILVFTGGIGDASPLIREKICDNMAYAGIKINKGLNDKGQNLISYKGGKVDIWVIPTDEESVIAKHVINLIKR